MSSSPSHDQQQDMMFDGDDDCQYIFPQRLMSILSDERNHDAICWLPHGRGFIIRNRNLFIEKIMPRFFPRRSKYSSFTRKLNRWNFNRVSSGPELGAYYHEFFLREKPHLAAQMFCKSARTKLAMTTDFPKPVPAAMVAPLLPHRSDAQQQQAMKPAPVMIQVVDSQGNRGPFTHNNPQHVDQTMQYLLQNQQSLFEPEPFQCTTTGNNIGSSPMAVSPTPLQQYHQHSFPHGQYQAHQHGNHQYHHHAPAQQHHQQPGHVYVGNHHVPHDGGYVEQSTPAHHQQMYNQPLLSTSDSADGADISSNMSVWQQVEQHKKHDERMMQFRQLMTVNMQRQQDHHKNSYRASAA